MQQKLLTFSIIIKDHMTPELSMTAEGLLFRRPKVSNPTIFSLLQKNHESHKYFYLNNWNQMIVSLSAG